MARIDRQLERLSAREAELHAEMAELSADPAVEYQRLAELDVEARDLVGRREALEDEWLEAASLLE
jgi:ATP-binding cassette subfamily F protein uup